MENEVKEKAEVKKTGPVSMSLTGIPRNVHKRILKYKTQITGKRSRDYSVKEAYVEFLKEASQAV